MRDDTPFPLYQPMRMYASIWNAEDWATQGGRIKTDWSQAPFTAFFRNYTANACVPYGHTIERGFVARVLVIAVGLTRSWMRRGSRN